MRKHPRRQARPRPRRPLPIILVRMTQLYWERCRQRLSRQRLLQTVDTWLPKRHRLILGSLLGLLAVALLLPGETAPVDTSAGRSMTVLGTAETTALLSEAEPPALSEEALAKLSSAATETIPHTGLSSVPETASPDPSLPPDPILNQNQSAAGHNREIIEVRSGDNLSLIFSRAGLSARDVYEVSQSTEHSDVLTRLHPGYRLAFDLDNEQRLQHLEVRRSPLESFYFTRVDAGFEGSHERRIPEASQAFKEATITDSLFLAAQRGGIPTSLTMELADIFGGVIDFLLDTRAGDSFNVLYEERYLDGEFIGNGPILAAQFVNRGQTYTAVRYTDAAGKVSYFNPEGESMRKAFLRNPVDFVRISSGFNPNRRHPILNTIRAHKGTDYAAPTGTPVVAAGDGRVTWAARNGSFGNLVVIQHTDRFETKYAHLDAYARGISKGSRVKQGQVIGYVGTTGGATGPHLHYEFLIDGVHRNPRTVHDLLPKAESIPAAEMANFKQHSQLILADLSSYRRNPTLAQHENQEP